MSANQNTPRSEAEQGRIAVTPGKTPEERRANFRKRLTEFVRENRGPTETDDGAGDSR